MIYNHLNTKMNLNNIHKIQPVTPSKHTLWKPSS